MKMIIRAKADFLIILFEKYSPSAEGRIRIAGIINIPVEITNTMLKIAVLPNADVKLDLKKIIKTIRFV